MALQRRRSGKDTRGEPGKSNRARVVQVVVAIDGFERFDSRRLHPYRIAFAGGFLGRTTRCCNGVATWRQGDDS
jgi:hypothetical protein